MPKVLPRTRSRFGRLAGSLCLVAYLCGCTSWRTAELPAPRLIQEKAPSRIQVKTVTGERFEIVDPVMRRDTVSGFDPSRQPLTVPLSDVESVKISKLNVWKTVVFAFVVMGVIGGLTADLTFD